MHLSGGDSTQKCGTFDSSSRSSRVSTRSSSFLSTFRLSSFLLPSPSRWKLRHDTLHQEHTYLEHSNVRHRWKPSTAQRVLFVQAPFLSYFRFVLARVDLISCSHSRLRKRKHDQRSLPVDLSEQKLHLRGGESSSASSCFLFSSRVLTFFLCFF